jgi:imidazolonepropionase-like amidohydrolase
MANAATIQYVGPLQPDQSLPAQQGTSTSTITNVRIFDGDTVTENQTVVFNIRGEGDDCQKNALLNGAGMTLLPGLIDAHVHLPDPTVDTDELTQHSISLLEHMAKFGITTALDMGFMPKSLRDSLRDRTALTDIRFAGNFATSTGSLHCKLLMTSAANIVDTTEDAVHFVQARVAEEADYIKIIADVPGPSQDVVNTLASEAAKHDKIAVAHASRYKSFEMAQEGNVPVITHVPLDTSLDEPSAVRMAREGRVCVPTLVMMEAMSKGLLVRGLKYEAAKHSVELLHKAKVPIIAGTDANKSAVARVYHGEDYFRELELLSDAGLSNLEVLQAATSLPAKHFKLNDRGVVKEGKRADLVLVEGNPLQNLKALQNVKGVWIAGYEVDLTSG